MFSSFVPCSRNSVSHAMMVLCPSLLFVRCMDNVLCVHVGWYLFKIMLVHFPMTMSKANVLSYSDLLWMVASY